jgi:hypothetical protein
MLTSRAPCSCRSPQPAPHRDGCPAPEFEVEAALLINEGSVQCVPVVFARPLQKDAHVELGAKPFLNGVHVAALDPVRAMQRGPGLVAFVLEDPMDVRWFHPGDVARLDSR